MKVYVVDPKTYDGTIATIENIGKLAGTEDGATAVADKMTAAKQEVQAKVGDLPKATTFLEIYSKPLMTAGSGTFIDDMITHRRRREHRRHRPAAGSRTSAPRCSSRTTRQVYIADSGSMSKPGDINKRAGFAELTAVKDGKVYVIEDSIIARPGPRLAEGLAAAGRDDPSGGVDRPVTKRRPHRHLAGDPPGRRHPRSSASCWRSPSDRSRCRSASSGTW